MSGRPKLHIAPIKATDARKACARWHYSRTMPAGKSICFGVWEGGKFSGAIVFSYGANHNIGAPFQMPKGAAVELCRVALAPWHVWETSRACSIAIRMFRKANTQVRLLVSYADSSEGHHGGIYKAMGWICTGVSKTDVWRINGKRTHARAYTGAQFGDPSKKAKVRGELKITKGVIKYRYALALDDLTAARVEAMRQPAPEAGDGRDQRHSGGAAPTLGLSANAGGSCG